MYESVHRDPSLTVDGILDHGRRSYVVQVTDRSPMVVVNRVGQPMMALPTFVSFPSSHTYSDGGSGLVWDTRV